MTIFKLKIKKISFLAVFLILHSLNPSFAEAPPSVILLGKIQIEEEINPEIENAIKSIILTSIRKSTPRSYLVLEMDWIQSQIEHIQNNKIKKSCQKKECEDALIENLDIDYRITGKYSVEFGKSRILLKLVSIESNRIVNSKEGIFSDSEMEYTIDEVVKSLLLKGYKPNYSEYKYDSSFQFPDIAYDTLNSDLRIFLNIPNDKIASFLKSFEKKIIQADSKYREGNLDFAYNTYLYILNSIKSGLTNTDQNLISDYIESIQSRLYTTAIHLISMEAIILDKNTRNNIENPEVLNKNLKEYQNLYSIYKSTGNRNPDVEDAILGRIIKLEYLLLKAYEKQGNYFNSYGRFYEADKNYFIIKNLISENKNLKNIRSYINSIDKRIEKNKIDQENFLLSKIHTLYYIAEKENFQRSMAFSKGDLLAAEGSYQQIKYCLEKAEGVLVSQKKETPGVRLYYNKILDLLKNKTLNNIVTKFPKRESPYFTDYSLLWNSLYFPGLGQILAFPDEDKSRSLFYSGIIAFTHLIYRGSVYYNANNLYNNTDRINPILQLSLDETTRNLTSYYDYNNFQGLKNSLDTASQNFSISAGIFGFIYILSLSDVMLNYSKIMSSNSNNFSPMNQSAKKDGFQFNFVPVQNNTISNTKINEEGKYELYYKINF